MSTPTPNGRFSRVFSESDEIRILVFLIRTTKSISPPPIGTPTINRIIERLNHRFTPSQINDKLRRLRDKYRKHVKNRHLVKTHHDRRVFKLSRRIWGEKKSPKNKTEKGAETVESGKGEGEGILEKYPYLVAEFSRALPDNEVWKERLKGLDEMKLRKMDQEWVHLKVDEAKLVAKKAVLVKQHIMEIIGE
ncbi:Detected protein of unknown function [Hibiscus syriacus]|uniref:Glabrous enhancer-binding protein-like DBD domain-containing protein n=1 Tax=Hibiscus syriacus TaxID=106335 RepID=A0A6A2YMF9_HIBSY|nr:probable transcription factor At4g00390 [Hibiscus syriacus]KAE8680543.1 Detected protein of unknown function [Hibiscus syriacus]